MWTQLFEVECNEHCVAVLKKRMQDGLLPEVPVEPDVSKFIPAGRAQESEVVLGGFPCQALDSEAVSLKTFCIPVCLASLLLCNLRGCPLPGNRWGLAIVAQASSKRW